jgi:hypothetical protein
MRTNNDIEIVITVEIPDKIRALLPGEHSVCRYEMALSLDPKIKIRNETLWLCEERPNPRTQLYQVSLFPEPPAVPVRLRLKRRSGGTSFEPAGIPALSK